MSTSTSTSISTSASSLTQQALETLRRYNACDISDALLKLHVPFAGFLPDLIPYHAPPPPPRDIRNDSSSQEAAPILIAPASTVLFIPKTASPDSDGSIAPYPEGNIPPGEHWVDLTPPGTIAVLSQPEGQKNAVLGGIMALRMESLGAVGAVVHGRIRDVQELKGTRLMIWAQGTSTVGAGGSTKPHAINVPLTISGVAVTPGDVIFSDPRNGVVVIPRANLEAVLELLPRLVAADERVKEAVREEGMSVREAFEVYRKGL